MLTRCRRAGAARPCRAFRASADIVSGPNACTGRGPRTGRPAQRLSNRLIVVYTFTRAAVNKRLMRNGCQQNGSRQPGTAGPALRQPGSDRVKRGHAVGGRRAVVKIGVQHAPNHRVTVRTRAESILLPQRRLVHETEFAGRRGAANIVGIAATFDSINLIQPASRRPCRPTRPARACTRMPGGGPPASGGFRRSDTV